MDTMDTLRKVGGVVRYEFAMQVRRITFWVMFILLASVPLIQFTHTQNYTHDANLLVTRQSIVVIEMAGAAVFVMLATGLLLADRMRRDHTTGIDELFTALPVAPLTRLGGKFVGNVLAMLVPATGIYLLGIALLTLHWSDLSIIPLALAGFVAFVFPATLFIAACTIAFTTVLWPPLYQFLFVGYILWDSLDPAGPIPTLNGTVLAPSERLVMTGIFHFTPFRTSDSSYYPHAPLWLGIANIIVLLATGALALLAAWRWQQWQQ